MSNKLFTENGFLSPEGERVFKEMLDAKVRTIINSAEGETEIQIVGSLLQQRIGNLVSESLQAKRDLTKKLSQMTDEQFEGYLKAKYGSNWMFQSLTTEEIERCPKLFHTEEIESILKERAKHVTKFPRNGVRFK